MICAFQCTFDVSFMLASKGKWFKTEVREAEVLLRTIWNSLVVLDLYGSYVAIIWFVVVRRNSCPSSEVRETF